MAEYTPTQEDVLEVLLYGGLKAAEEAGRALDTVELNAMFARFVESVKADGWDEGQDTCAARGGCLEGEPILNPYRKQV